MRNTVKGGAPPFQGWKMVALLVYVLTYTAGFGFYTWAIYVPRWVEEFSVNTSSVVLAGAIGPITFGLASPIVGQLVQRLGVRRVICSGIVASSLVGILLSHVTQVWHLYVAGCLGGVAAASSILVPAQALIANWFDRQRGLALGLTLMGLGIGGFVMPVVTSAIIVTLSHYLQGINEPGEATWWLRVLTESGDDLSAWRGSLRIGALMALVFFLPAVYFFMIDRPSELGQHVDGIAPESDAGQEESLELRGATLQQAVRTVSFWLILAVYFSQIFLISGIQANVPNFAEKEAGFGIMQAARFVAASSFVTIFTRVAAGWLCDRMNPKYLIALAGLMLAGSAAILRIVVLSWSWQGPVPILAFAVLQGIAVGCHSVAFPLSIARCFGEREFPRINGSIMGGLALGAVLGPLIVALSFDVWATYARGFELCMLVGLISALSALSLRTSKSTWSEQKLDG